MIDGKKSLATKCVIMYPQDYKKVRELLNGGVAQSFSIPRRSWDVELLFETDPDDGDYLSMADMQRLLMVTDVADADFAFVDLLGNSVSVVISKAKDPQPQGRVLESWYLCAVTLLEKIV